MRDVFLMLLRTGLRSVLAHRRSSLAVGAIIAFGTALVVVGTSLLDSIERGMAESVTGSLAGHIQVYSANAEDELSLFGGAMMGQADVGEIRTFAPVRETLEAVPNVKAVVPMGIVRATASLSGELQRTIEGVRDAVDAGEQARLRLLREQLEGILQGVRDELRNSLALAASPEKVEQQLQHVARVLDATFWRELRRDPEPALLFLDTKIAPLAGAKRRLFFRNVGTNLQRFARLFDRFRLVKGELIPPGERGVLFSRQLYEQQVKHPVARELDAIHTAFVEEQARLATDPQLRERAERLPSQYQRILFQLHGKEALALRDALRAFLGAPDASVEEALREFLTLNDANLVRRYEWFYEHVAPRIDLYAVDVGDELVLRALTRRGYLTSVAVKVYGVFIFDGLEGSDLAGAQNLVDLATFRSLYGVMTEAQRRELETIRQQVGIEDVARSEAESAFFGDDAAMLEEQTDSDFAAELSVDAAAEQAVAPPPTQALSSGLALSGAVLLDNPDQLETTLVRLERAIEEAGLGLQAMSWREASGLVGQFIIVMQLVLYTALVIIFSVAVVIINNAMVMSTLDRTGEIGTMRAVGAQRAFVTGIFLVEILALGAVAGSLGAIFGVGCVWLLGEVGIPAFHDVLVFLFSGPRLYPQVGVANVGIGLVSIFLVSAASTLYPARVAAKIEPVVAMQRGE